MKLEAWELFDLKMRRENKPPSNAKEQRYYRDPAQSVEFESELKRKEAVKKKMQQKKK